MNGNVLRANAFLLELGWSWCGAKNIPFAFGLWHAHSAKFSDFDRLPWGFGAGDGMFQHGDWTGSRPPLAGPTSFGQGCGQRQGAGAYGSRSRRGLGLGALGAAVRQLGVVLSDRGSKYAVSGCKVTDRAAIDAALKELKCGKKYAKATHNTWGVLIDGVPFKSDDGESGAGMVILRMLERVGRQNELIIVTRWYGGKHLGGDRFRHVQNATRMYLDGA